MSFTARLVSSFVILAFAATSILPLNKTYAASSVAGLPVPGTMLNLSPAYVPALMKGLRVHPENPLLFDFIIDTGHSGLNGDTPELRKESEKLIKYFLATLTVPEKDLWVNLSPYEKDRIIADGLGQTELGRDMLAQDYMLKQLTASLVYPEKELGKTFWDRVYAKAQSIGGAAQIPINTFNKVWILPDQAAVYVRNNTVFVVEGHLKVMLDEDYLATQKNIKANPNNVTSQIVREIILPEIEQEVNNGKNFAPLRQIFYSLVLASWYKKHLKDALLNQVYSEKNKINGVHSDDNQIKEKIYQQYLEAYKKGVFNYIKEDVKRLKDQPLPRKYFSGGQDWAQSVASNPVEVAKPAVRDFAAIGPINVVRAAADRAMNEVSEDVEKRAMSGSLNELENKTARLIKDKSDGYIEDLLAFKAWIERNRAKYDEWAGFVGVSDVPARIASLVVTIDAEIKSNPALALQSIEGERTANNNSPEDIKALLERRAKGEAGFHLNVDSKVIDQPATIKDVVDWRSIPQDTRRALARKEEELYQAGQINSITLAGGEATRFGGSKAFEPINPDLGEFLQFRVANRRKIGKRLNLNERPPFYALSSEKLLPGFKENLAKRQYYGEQPHDFKVFTQGLVDTFIATDQEIQENPEFRGKVDQYLSYARAQRAANEEQDGIYRFQGERRLIGEGPFAAIASFIISGRLVDALRRGVKGVSIYNLDNILAIEKIDGMMAHFLQGGHDVGFIVAEKNIIFTVKDNQGNLIEKDIIVRFMDNVISFDNGLTEVKGGRAEKNGFQFVINHTTKKLDVYSKGSLLETKLDIKAETGGTLVQPVDHENRPVGPPIIKEGFELKSDFHHADAPFFNTNTMLLRLEKLLDILGVTQKQLEEMNFDQRSKLVRENLVSKIHPFFEFKNHEVPGEYPDLGVVDKGKTKIPVVQLTRLILQMERLPGVKTVHYFASRSDVFAPIKSREDMLPMAQKHGAMLLRRYLDYSGDPWSRDTAMASDKAALAESANQGGIDFDADKLNLKESGGAINIKFDKAMIEQFNRGDFTGVRPVILNVTTIPSVLPLLGLSPGREEEQLAAAAS